MALYSRFDYQLGSGQVVIPAPDDVVVVKMSVSNVSSPVAVPANFKYNADVAMSMGFDDALINQYKHIFPVMVGGISGLNGKTYPGIYYSDGTGKMINMRATLVIPAAGLKETSANSMVSFSFDNAREMVSKPYQFGINNHSKDHDGTVYDRYKDLMGAEQIFYNRLGYVTRVGTTPASEDGFMYTFFKMGYLIHNSTYNEANSEITIYGKFRASQFPTGSFNLDRFTPGDSYDTNGLSESKRYSDEIRNMAISENHEEYGNDFTHGPGNADNIAEALKYKLDAILAANKKAWFPSVQEAAEYFEVSRGTTRNISISGNVMTLTLDQSSISPNCRWRDMSLLLSGITLGSVISVEGADEATFNASTGLLNVYNFNTERNIDPSTKVTLPQITSLTRSGNNVNIVYDKPVTQNMFEAYTISGNNATGITGSGNNWTVSFANQIGTGKTMSYREYGGTGQIKGNATGLDGLRVPDYINYPIS